MDRPESERKGQQQTIEPYFQEHPPETIKEAMRVIEKITGLKRSQKPVRKFLKRIGLKRRKVGMIPAKTDIKEQEE